MSNASTGKIEAKLKGDFKVFLYAIWRELNLPIPTPIQNDIADFLQYGAKRSIIEAFRGVGKSWITSAFVLWVLFCDPQKKIMVVSASKERSDSFSTFTKRLIEEIKWLHHLRPNRGQRDSKIAFDVGSATADHSPSVKSVGITGQLTGSRADIIIADDIEVLNNSATQTARDKLSELVKEFDAILKPLDTSRIIYLGTPQLEMSLYNVLPDRGYQTRIWPAEYVSEDDIDKYKGKLAPYIVDIVLKDPSVAGHTTEPTRFSDTDLLERKLSYGKAGYALQFMLDTTLADADRYPLKLQDLMVMNLDLRKAPSDLSWASGSQTVIQDIPTIGLTGDRFYTPMWTSEEHQEYSGKFMFIDPSGRGKDETAYAVTYFLNGNIFLMDVGGFKEGYSEKTLEALANIAKTYQVNEIMSESNMGDGMFNSLLKPYLERIYPCTLTEDRAVGQKETRIIDVLEPVCMQHRLVVNKRIIEEDFRSTQSDVKHSLFYQFTRITADRGSLAHDDRLDAVHWAVKYWVDYMSRDSEVALKEHKDELLMMELENWHSDMFGSSRKETKGWFDTL